MEDGRVTEKYIYKIIFNITLNFKAQLIAYISMENP